MDGADDRRLRNARERAVRSDNGAPGAQNTYAGGQGPQKIQPIRAYEGFFFILGVSDGDIHRDRPASQRIATLGD